MMSRYIDGLTGLPNSPALEMELDRAIAEDDGVALASVDVDYFVEINNKFGMDRGDQLLQTLAALLSEANPGAVYRISGDEFAILLRATTLEQAFLRMERVRTDVAEATDRFNLPEGQQVTVTIGVAHYPRDTKDRQGLMRAANAAVMSAKETGRNIVALPPNEEMVMKSCYYAAASVRKLKALAERLNQKESRLLREALDDLLKKYDLR